MGAKFAIPADEMAIVRRLAGDATIRLRQNEIRIAAARVDRHGASASQVARRLGVSERTVQRHRARRRAQAVAA